MSEYLDLLDVGRLLRQACKAAGSQRAWAQTHGLTEQFVSSVANGHRQPSAEMLFALGLRRVTKYTKLRNCETPVGAQGQTALSPSRANSAGAASVAPASFLDGGAA